MQPAFVSILIPVRNEERYIERCLYSIAAQTHPRDRLEVLVIDGMSDDRTREIITRFAAETSIDLRLFDNPKRLPAAAMNIGLRFARGDVILRVDGHAALSRNYVEACLRALESFDAECAGGVLANEGFGYAGRAIAAAMSSRLGVGGALFRTGGEAGEVDTVAFGVYRNEVFQQVGYFDEELPGGEDDELNYRLRDAGGVIVLVPEAVATYIVRSSFAALFRQYFRYGLAKPRVLARHPRQAQLRQLVPAAAVAAGLVACADAARGNRGPLTLALGSYAVATTASAVGLGRRFGWRVVPAVPLAFASMHTAYGMGFLAGVAALAADAGVRQPSHTGQESPFV